MRQAPSLELVRRAVEVDAAYTLAHDAGAGCVFGGADFLSTSHRDMERAGMRLLFVRAI